MGKKYTATLNNYQYGSYPFNTLHQFITKSTKVDRLHRTVVIEGADDKGVQQVNKHLAGSNYGKKSIINELKEETKKVVKNGK